MKLVCPECGATGSIAQFSSDVDARAVCEQLAALPAELGTPLLRYLALWRPAKRALTWPHARRLLEDLVQLMQSPAVHRRGRDWPVTPAMWRQALVQMTEQRARLQLPLRSHGYLLEIVAGLADRAEAKAEDRHEADLRAGFRPASADTPQPVRAEEPADAQRLFAAQLARIEARRKKQEKTS